MEKGNRQQLVLDTCVLRDLHCAHVLGLIFRLGYEVLTTDLIEKRRELEPVKPHMLKGLGLKIEELPGSLVAEIPVLRSRHVGPSVEDLSALLLARQLGCPVVTRDGPLERACHAEQVAVRDTLWLLRKMVVAQILSEGDAAGALEIINTKRVRPPNPDWTTQIRRWRKAGHRV